MIQDIKFLPIIIVQARKAQQEGVDYIGVGPIFPHPNKGF